MKWVIATAGLTLGLLGASRVLVKTGTVAPEGSPWHAILVEMDQSFRAISNGAVRMRVYPGGVLGDELDMLKKLRVGQLQAVALSGVGLSRVEPSVGCLQLPLMFRSYDELDHVMARMLPEIEARMEARGYVVLNWSDAGWVYFFSKTPARTPNQWRNLRLFINTGDPDSLALYQANGFRPVPLAVTDMMTGLQTGMIDAFDVPPLLALLNQWFGSAPYMLDLRWAPLVGGTVVLKKTWDRIEPQQRAQMLAASRASGTKYRPEIRRMNDEAIKAMEQRGLKVLTLDDATRAEWEREVDAALPKLRDSLCPGALMDQVRTLRDAYRARSR